MRVLSFRRVCRELPLERSRQMLTSHSTGGFATTSAPEGFDLKDFEEAGLRVVERRFGPRDTIFTPGDPDDQLYFLLSGTVRLYKIYGDYKEATTALLRDGGVFGKLNLVEGRWQDVFAEAVSDVRVASVQKAALERVVKMQPEVSTRLATLLLNLSERFGVDGTNGSGGVMVDVRLTHQDLANMIASTREAVSKVMSELQREGVIETRNRRVIILNR